MKVGLDTSVVLRLLTGEPGASAKCALAWLRETLAAGSTVVVSDLVVSEVYFALQYHFGVSKGEAIEKLGQFLSSGEVCGEGVAGRILGTAGLDRADPGFVDRMIHEQYAAGGAEEIVTFERSAGKLARSRVLRA